MRSAARNVISFARRGGFIDQVPHERDGGCWGVAHTSACGNHGAFLAYYFRPDDAIAAARAAAEQFGAVFEGGVER